MLYLKNGLICNLGPFSKFEFDCNLGTVGVVGINGAGKTTVIELVYGTLTGDFSGFPGVKTDCIRAAILADKKENAYAKMIFECNGVEFSIERSIRPAKQCLKITGHEKVYTNDKDIQRELVGLGIDKRLLDFAVFKRQNAIFDVFKATPTERAKAYQILNDTASCEELWDIIGGKLNTDEAFRSEIVDNSDEIMSRITESENQKLEVTNQREQHTGMLMKEVYRQKATDIVNNRRRYQQYGEQLEAVEGLLPGLEAKLASADTKRTAQMERVLTYEREVAKYDTQLADAKGGIKLWEHYNNFLAGKERLNKAAAGLNAEIAKHPQPDDFAVKATTLPRLQETLHNLKRDLAEARKRLEALGKDGTTACPTCGTEGQRLADVVAAARVIVKNAPKEVIDLTVVIEGIQAGVEAHRQWTVWNTGYQTRLTSHNESVKAMKEVAKPEGTEERLKAIVSQHAAAKEALSTANEDLDAAKEAFTKAKTSLDNNAKQCDTLHAEMGACQVTDEVHGKAVERLAQHTQAEKDLARIDGVLESIDKSIQERNDELTRLRNRLKRSQRARDLARILNVVRDVVHRDNLPNKVAQANLIRMEASLNKTLALFGDPFWVEADPSLSLLVHFPGEPPRRAERLSGGQLSVLAVAFWYTVNSLFGDAIGMLVLDEPTANMDATNVSYLAAAMKVFSNKLRGKQQLIMVTHSEQLRSSFDQVIEVKR